MILFVEPNPFASRLHVLKPLIQGASRVSERVIVVCPTRSPDTDWDDFVRDLPSNVEFRIVESVVAAPRMRVPWKSLWCLISAASRLSSSTGTKLVLTAVDDYMPLLPALASAVRLRVRFGRCFIVRYRVADLIPGAAVSTRDRLKSLATSFAAKVMRAETLMFDERVACGDKVRWLPDPWHGPFGQESQSSARQVLGWPEHWQVAAFIGGQDERKGFDVGIRAVLEADKHLPHLRVVVVGAVVERLRAAVESIQEELGDRFIHIQNYLSDADLAAIFAAADVVCLPYHRRFTSTSGVLVRAAASATPVVASDHGLVGWRVKNYSLGETFQYPQHVDMGRAIERLLSMRFDSRQALDFSSRSSGDQLSSIFERILRD